MTRHILWILLPLFACGGTGTIGVDAELHDNSRQVSRVSDAALALELDGATLLIQRVRIAMSELELEGREDRDEVEVGDSVIDLALNGSATPIVFEQVPTATYRELGLELMTADASDGKPFVDFEGASILVEGERITDHDDSQPFTYRSDLVVEVERDLDRPARVRHASQVVVSVPIDVAAWFTLDDGAILDPTDPQDAALIERQILAAMDDIGDLETADGDDSDSD